MCAAQAASECDRRGPRGAVADFTIGEHALCCSPTLLCNGYRLTGRNCHVASAEAGFRGDLFAAACGTGETDYWIVIGPYGRLPEVRSVELPPEAVLAHLTCIYIQFQHAAAEGVGRWQAYFSCLKPRDEQQRIDDCVRSSRIVSYQQVDH